MPIQVKHFYMVRHGQTEANAARLMAGTINSPLTKLGRAQAKNLHNIVLSLDIKPEIIAHSHLDRARDTANIINQALNLPTAEDTDFAEIDAGDWEGVPYDDCPNLLQDHVDPPNGETFDNFSIRITKAKNKLFSRKETPALIVSHGGVFKALARIYGIKSPLIPNCALYEFTPTKVTQAFPWDVYHHKPSDYCQNTVTKELVSGFNHPDLK